MTVKTKRNDTQGIPAANWCSGCRGRMSIGQVTYCSSWQEDHQTKVYAIVSRHPTLMLMLR